MNTDHHLFDDEIEELIDIGRNVKEYRRSKDCQELPNVIDARCDTISDSEEEFQRD